MTCLGTGKNKIVDRLLHVIGWEREYMQLHRDTTVQSLTVTPTLTNGVISYDDSPVIKAVKYGRVLVVRLTTYRLFDNVIIAR